ncbi:MAG: hypothetical protein ACOC2F_05435, partial [Bacteroidota bacterium]
SESEPVREPQPEQKMTVESVEEEHAVPVAQEAPKTAEPEEKPGPMEMPKARPKQPKKKKAKKDTPAKIIKLPSKPLPALEEPQEEPGAEKFVARPIEKETGNQEPDKQLDTEKSKDRKRKKRGKQLEADENEKKLF